MRGRSCVHCPIQSLLSSRFSPPNVFAAAWSARPRSLVNLRSAIRRRRLPTAERLAAAVPSWRLNDASGIAGLVLLAFVSEGNWCNSAR